MKDWTKAEKKIIRDAFEKANKKDYKRLCNYINSYEAKTPDDVWELRKFLNNKAKEFNRKYEYRNSMLLISLAVFVNEGLITFDDLEGLPESTILSIKKLLDIEF